jgi:hypothetical protein
MKEVVAKHQQVLVRAWFLTDVAFNSVTGLNVKPSSLVSAVVFLF